MQEKQITLRGVEELSKEQECELFNLELLESRLEMSDFLNPSPPAPPQ